MAIYKKRDVDKRLADIGAEPLYKEGRDYCTTYNGVRIPGIIVTHPGNEVPDIAVNKLARKIAEVGSLDVKYLKGVLTGRKKIKGGLEGLTAGIIALSSVLVLLVAIQQNVLTGFAVAENIPESSLNVGISICILGLVGLITYFIYKKKK